MPSAVTLGASDWPGMRLVRPPHWNACAHGLGLQVVIGAGWWPGPGLVPVMVIVGLLFVVSLWLGFGVARVSLCLRAKLRLE